MSNRTRKFVIKYKNAENTAAKCKWAQPIAGKMDRKVLSEKLARCLRKYSLCYFLCVCFQLARLVYCAVGTALYCGVGTALLLDRMNI